MSLRVGQSAGLAVVLVGAKDVQWVEMTLAYDEALAQIADVSVGSLLTLDGSAIQTARTVEPGRLRIRFTRPTPASGSGAVASVTLKGLKPGTGTLAVETLTVGHANETAPIAAPAAGRIIVSP